jgi:outer membrane lipoprotein-sorting protein
MKLSNISISWRIFWLLFCASCPSQIFAETADTNTLLSAWLNTQTNIQSWSADVTQVRSLKALTQPLTSIGHVWFVAPNRFHWELGNPPQTIAIRQADQLLVIYPRLKRAERYPLTGPDAGQFKDTLALLDAGFPRSRADVDSRFNVLSEQVADGVDQITLQPKSDAARRFMPQIQIGIDANSFGLHSTELRFQDGSTMQTIFSNAKLNPKIDDKLFRPDIEGYKVVEPFKK